LLDEEGAVTFDEGRLADSTMTCMRAQIVGTSRRGASPDASLTPRESEVLSLMAEGRSNAGIAERVVISEGAVEKHWSTSSRSPTWSHSCSGVGSAAESTDSPTENGRSSG
jgi:DNA-binding CsgD family transcriptional regulator